MSVLSPSSDLYNKQLSDYISQERAAVDLISSIGQLLYDKNIELVLFRNHLVDASISEIIRLHRYADEVVKRPIDIFTSAELAKIILNSDIAPAKIDIGRLSAEWAVEKESFASKEDFLKKLKPVYEIIKETKNKLSIDNKDTIGFVGAPWTLLWYMLNRKSPKDGNFNVFPKERYIHDILIKLDEFL